MTSLSIARAYTHTPTSDQSTDQQLQTIESIQDNYSFHVRDFTAWVRETDQDITLEAVSTYFEKLNSSDYSANTVRIKRQAVLKRIRFLFKSRPLSDRVLLEEAVKDLNEGTTRAPRIASSGIGSDKVVSPLEYERLLEGSRSERQRLFMMFLWVTGCRVSEMLGIKLQHCDQQGDRIHIRILGKGKKERYVWISSALYQRIQLSVDGNTWLFETRTGKPYTRSYVSNQIAKIGKLVLNRKISAHTFRHSFATRKIKETGKIQAVSHYLGHSSVAITLSLYCHEELNAEDLSSESDMIGMGTFEGRLYDR